MHFCKNVYAVCYNAKHWHEFLAVDSPSQTVEFQHNIQNLLTAARTRLLAIALLRGIQRKRTAMAALHPIALAHVTFNTLPRNAAGNQSGLKA